MSTATQTIPEQAAELRTLKLEYDELSKAAKEAKAAYDRAEVELFERLHAEGVQSIKVDGINFVTAETVYGQIQDRSEFVTWAEENAPELLETKERKGLINELVRERLNDGELLPPGVGFYEQQYVSQRVG